MRLIAISKIRMAGIALCLLLVSAGCGNDMKDQPRYEPLEQSNFFPDGRSSRPLVEGTIPRGHLKEDDLFYRGKVNGEYAAVFPFEMTEERLRRGQERYNIFCAVCHDRLGYGEGMIVKRGFTPAKSFHTDRLRNAAPGYLFEIISQGLANMPGYANQIPAADRWAIIGYLRVLQRSQNVPVTEIPEVQQKLLLEPNS